MTTQHQVNQQQYQEKSEAYLQSTVHAQGIEFAKMREAVLRYPQAQVLDLGCGGGHVSYQVAAVAERVIAYDLCAEMVELVLQQAQQKALHNIQGKVGAAEQLDFPDQHFDIVISRYSAHHWHNLGQAMQEIHRVLKPHGRVIFFDVIGSADPILDTFLQTIEMIRDPSHVRDYSVAEWTGIAEYHGFHLETIEKQSLQLDFQAWVERMQTPAASVATIRELQQKVSDHVRRYYQIQADGSFNTPTCYLQFSKS